MLNTKLKRSSIEGPFCVLFSCAPLKGMPGARFLKSQSGFVSVPAFIPMSSICSCLQFKIKIRNQHPELSIGNNHDDRIIGP
ncbi:rCG59004 [Rattus norvegicus]|uniref:RCG59004 n=1 Tax=Rattus norvegicus TaxID=10116 RepID=A6JPL6_RAT|nr:rCG59004 [Rattus norvegicus]